MHIHRTEGVILQSLDFQDYHQILTVFTRDEGLVKLITKRSYGKRQGTFTTPLTQAEFIYKAGNAEIFKCQEVSIIHQHLGLRQNLVTLEAACEILKAILLTQLLHATAPQLYALLVLYLTRMPLFEDPHAITASFRLKLLKHEGLLGDQISNPVIYRLAHARTFAEIETIQLDPYTRESIHQFFLAQVKKNNQ